MHILYALCRSWHCIRQSQLSILSIIISSVACKTSFPITFTSRCCITCCSVKRAGKVWNSLQVSEWSHGFNKTSCQHRNITQRSILYFFYTEMHILQYHVQYNILLETLKSENARSELRVCLKGTCFRARKHLRYFRSWAKDFILSLNKTMHKLQLCVHIITRSTEAQRETVF